MDYIFYTLLALFVFWILYKQFAPVKGVRNVSAKQFQEESKGNKVIDVREVHEYKRGHIAGAANIPLSQLPQRMGKSQRTSRYFSIAKAACGVSKPQNCLVETDTRNLPI